MIDISELMTDPDLSQDFVIKRDSGEWVKGRWIENTTSLPFSGVVTVAGKKELGMVPYGDRTKGVMCFHSTDPIYLTKETGISDIAIWHGEDYKIQYVYPYSDYYGYKAIGTRLKSV